MVEPDGTGLGGLTSGDQLVTSAPMSSDLGRADVADASAAIDEDNSAWDFASHSKDRLDSSPHDVQQFWTTASSREGHSIWPASHARDMATLDPPPSAMRMGGITMTQPSFSLSAPFTTGQPHPHGLGSFMSADTQPVSTEFVSDLFW